MKFAVWHHQSTDYPDKAHRRVVRIAHSRHGVFVAVECFHAIAVVQGKGAQVVWDRISCN